MAEETAPSSSEKSKGSIDLDALSGLNFGPDWADGKSSSASKHKRFEERGAPKGKGKRPAPPSSRDRRSGGRPQRGRSDRNQERGDRSRRDSGRGHPQATFQPTVKVDLYPQDEAFDALVKRLRTSARTYQLFEIAHLLLEKPERYVVVVAPKQKPRADEAAPPLLYYSVPGHLPFESEEQAINHVLKEHLDLFFEVEEIEVEPPKGNFVIINRCGITGELLGPPNYHRYQEFLQRHYAARINGMSYERFQSKIVASKEQEDIDAWLESMKKGARYTVKDRQENEPESLETLEAARQFLLTHRKDKVVGSGDSVRFAGRDIERLPPGDIRRSVESYVEQQKHFPLDSANNIRGRLRRHKFAVYKKGNKGVSYVCAVKRKFRDEKTLFTDSINDLIDFIEKHPDIPASKLSNEYIGIDTEKQQPEVLEMKETTKTRPSEPTESAPVAEESTPTEPSKTETPTAVESSTKATPKATLSEEEQEQLNQLMLDLRWLITEGYVTEYGNGRLFAPAPLPRPSKKADKSTKATPTKDDSPQDQPAEAQSTKEAAEASPPQVNEPPSSAFSANVENVLSASATDEGDQTEEAEEPNPGNKESSDELT